MKQIWELRKHVKLSGNRPQNMCTKEKEKQIRLDFGVLFCAKNVDLASEESTV